MKLYGSDGEEKIVRWFDHAPACKQCREVNLDSLATFAYSCAQGGVLLMEEMKRRQAPVERQKAKEVEDWAKRAGVFKTATRFKVVTKYVGD